MQNLTIEAVTPDTALALREALSGFRAELRVTEDGRSYVTLRSGRATARSWKYSMPLSTT
jgi:hypothetical protein